MKLKILNLNLWNYNGWEERKPKIIRFIKKENPDVIVFQEVRDHAKFNQKGDNQGKQLKRELGYKYYSEYMVTDKRKERPEKYKEYCVEGSAILSKYPLTNIEKKKLRKHKDDRYNCGNLYVRVKAGKPFDLAIVHFSNTSRFSALHLTETLKEIKKRKIKPLIIGDFNMIDSSFLSKTVGDEYQSSFDYKKYLSYPPANYTLDYIVIPKKMKFKSLRCVGKGLSDHKALVAEVMLK